jgi:UDP-N-acetyl-2-amino-2-deoxyglucuronate dehydrogenase
VTLRVGFLGGGLIANYHAIMLRSAQADIEVSLVHDPDPSRAESFASGYHASVAATEAEVIEASDAVYVCTWTSEHRRLVESVAAAGKAIFCEKPLAITLADAQAMVEVVQAAGVTNQVGLVLRDSPSFLLLKHLVAQPESGRVMSVVFRDDQYIPIQGMYGSTWRADRTKAGAGALIEHSIHDLDMLEWVGGDITAVNSRTSSFHQIDGIEDVAVVTMQFADGGVGTLTSVWHDLLARPSLRRVEVLCERAFYVLEGDALGPVRWTRDEATFGGVADGFVEGDALKKAITEAGLVARNPDGAFIEAVAAGQPAYPAFETALRPHALVEAVYRSADQQGAPVEPIG